MYGLTLAELRETIKSLRPRRPEAASERQKAAVAAIFLPTARGLGLLFTKRAADLGHHAGQISFPGGAAEPADRGDYWVTALRETSEEVGIETAELEMLGPLPDQPVLDYWLIHPFAAWWPEPRPLSPSPREVEKIIITPLSELERQHQNECWLIPDPARACRYDLAGDTLWGATARITGRLLDALRQKRRA